MRLAMIAGQAQLTPRDAGKLHGFSAASITRWIEQGTALRRGGRLKLRAVRYPAGWRTCEAWLADFLAALTADRAESASAKAVDDGARRANATLAASGW
jgi:hypothetical protein